MGSPQPIREWLSGGGLTPFGQVGRTGPGLGASSAGMAGSAVVPVAWVGRVSTDDQQDPVGSLLRQVRTSQSALPPGCEIVAYFYDVESGRKDLDARGAGRAHERFGIPLPRAGGIQDLLAEADRKSVV